MTHLSFGIKTIQEHTTYEDILEIWRAADALPVFEHAWLYDHFIPITGNPDGPCMDGWTLLSALATQTSRIRFGLMTNCNTYRHPIVQAKIAATLDIISHGRLDLGLGAGWNELEHTSYGIELLPPGKRLDQFAEACEVLKRLFTQQYTDFDGVYYQFQQARCDPRPVQRPHPPFVIGGRGERKTLRIVAQYASIWNYPGADLEEFKHKLHVLYGHCQAVGRDHESLRISVQPRVTPDDLPDLIERCKRFIDVGASHIILNLRLPVPGGIVERLADEVIPQLA